MKRNKKLLICLSDDEHAFLDELVRTYSLDGSRASKSFLVRYAIKRLPYQSSLPFPIPSTTGLPPLST